MFRDRYPLAWMFHRNTSRWPFNMQAIPDAPSQEAPHKEYFNALTFPLPEPRFPTIPLNEAISARLSCRRFTGTPLKYLELATLLKASYGIHDRIFLADVEFLERLVPSGGGLYPLELYLLVQNVESIEPGIYHYAVLHHTLEQIRNMQFPSHFTSDLFMGQPYVAKAAAIIVLAAVIERSLWKYGDRGYRYILFEAGHVAQNLNVVASAMGLGSLNLGGFFDSDMAILLGLDIEKEPPLYGVALGVPSSDDRTELRQATD
jgi:SagB-type dehydrogenase family enzyme